MNDVPSIPTVDDRPPYWLRDVACERLDSDVPRLEQIRRARRRRLRRERKRKQQGKVSHGSDNRRAA
jgi:hypothetical protein